MLEVLREAALGKSDVVPAAPADTLLIVEAARGKSLDCLSTLQGQLQAGMGSGDNSHVSLVVSGHNYKNVTTLWRCIACDSSRLCIMIAGMCDNWYALPHASTCGNIRFTT